jgi:hypothetical protein
MAENWGIGEITEEDVDDLFRAAGVNPATQPSITLGDYRDLVQIECVFLLSFLPSLSLLYLNSTLPDLFFPLFVFIYVVSLSKKEGVRVKLVDQLAEQPMVIIAQDPKISFDILILFSFLDFHSE